MLSPRGTAWVILLKDEEEEGGIEGEEEQEQEKDSRVKSWPVQ